MLYVLLHKVDAIISCLMKFIPCLFYLFYPAPYTKSSENASRLVSLVELGSETTSIFPSLCSLIEVLLRQEWLSSNSRHFAYITSGTTGLLYGGVAGTLRSAHPVVFTIAAGIQWSALGSTFWGQSFQKKNSTRGHARDLIQPLSMLIHSSND